MHRIENICYPRSGHRVLTSLVRRYFGDECHNGTIYGANAKTFETSTVNFLKNHDFGLETKVKDGIRYLIQVRYPMESIVSYYKLEVEMGTETETMDRWENFANRAAVYWNGFYKKWIQAEISSPRYICDYADLIDEPLSTFKEVVEFLGGTIDDDKIKSVIDDVGVERKNNIESFRYYDQGFFNTLRTTLGEGFVDYKNKRVNYVR